MHCPWSILTKLEIRQSTNPSPFDEFCCHDDDAAVLLPDHAPEVGDGREKASLSSDILALLLKQLSILRT